MAQLIRPAHGATSFVGDVVSTRTRFSANNQYQHYYLKENYIHPDFDISVKGFYDGHVNMRNTDLSFTQLVCEGGAASEVAQTTRQLYAPKLSDVAPKTQAGSSCRAL